MQLKLCGFQTTFMIACTGAESILLPVKLCSWGRTS